MKKRKVSKKGKVLKKMKQCTVKNCCPDCQVYADICKSVADALRRGSSITFILGALEREKHNLIKFADKQEE